MPQLNKIAATFHFKTFCTFAKLGIDTVGLLNRGNLCSKLVYSVDYSLSHSYVVYLEAVQNFKFQCGREVLPLDLQNIQMKF